MAQETTPTWSHCPKCGRRLRSPKAWHYCARIDIDTLFERKDPVVQTLYAQLLAEVSTWGDIEASGTKNCIVFTGRHTFLVAKPMKKALDLHFNLPDAHDAFPVYKCTPYKGYYVHYIRLHDAEDLDGDALGLMRLAYNQE
jgi:hypothetical protein